MNSTLAGILAIGSVAAAALPVAAGAQAAQINGSSVKIGRSSTTATFTAESCKADAARGKIQMTNVRSTNGIYGGMNYQMDCEGTPVSVTFAQDIPHKNISSMTIDTRSKTIEYNVSIPAASAPSYSRPQSNWAPAVQPKVDPMRDPACFAAMRNVTASGAGASVSVGPWTKTGTGLCYRNR